MSKDFNIYDVPVLRDAIKELEKFPTTTKTKKEHDWKVYQLQSLLEKIQADTHVSMIHPDYNYYFNQYKTGVILEKTAKKNSDRYLKLTIETTIKEIMSCISVERQTWDGRLVRDTLSCIGGWIEPAQLELKRQYEATR